VVEVTPTSTPTPTPPSTPTPPPTPTSTQTPSASRSGGVAALAEPVADERFGVMVTTRCGGGRAETAVKVSLGLLGDEELALDYVLTDDEDITRTGTVSLPAGEGAEFAVTGLPVGRYHVDFFDGGEEPVAVLNLEILTCLVTAVQCRQVTFTNPATNPAVGAFYGEGPGEQEEFEDFDLEPGQRRVVRTDRGLIQWGAGTVEGGAGDNFAIAEAGGGELVVPSDCGAESPEPKPKPKPEPEPDDRPSQPADGLADTGAGPFAMAGLVAGCVLTAAGAITLLRRRAT
jgi:hypothetical protein